MNPKEVNKNKYTPRHSEVKTLMKNRRCLKYQRVRESNHKGRTIRIKIDFSRIETEVRKQ